MAVKVQPQLSIVERSSGAKLSRGEEQTVVKNLILTTGAYYYKAHSISWVGTLPSGTLVGTLPYLRYERENLQDARDRSSFTIQYILAVISRM
jgi:hypothetical protein